MTSLRLSFIQDSKVAAQNREVRCGIGDASHIYRHQFPCMDASPLLIAAFVSAACALLLCLHHGWKHSHDPRDSHARQESCLAVCYFQPKDVCNFKTWNHEQFVLAFFLLAIALGSASFFA